MWKEFKEFALKGNVLDLAIGVIMAAAFGAIIKSVVENILMPAIGMIFGAPDFSAIQLGALNIGKFLNAIVNFAFIAIALFIFVKLISRIMPKKAEAVEVKPQAPVAAMPAAAPAKPVAVAKAKRAPAKSKPAAKAKTATKAKPRKAAKK